MTVEEQNKREGNIAHRGEKFTRSLAILKEQKKQLEQDVIVKNTDPLILLAKDKEIDAYLMVHDNTGAKQGEKFGQELARNLEDRHVISGDHVAEKGLIRNSENKLVPSEEDRKRHIGMVTVVELSRLNSEGGHDAGNKAMSSTVQVIENKIQAALRADPRIIEALQGKEIEDLYEIYHTRGADFAYTLDLSMLPDEIQGGIAKLVSKEIGEQRTENVGKIEGSLLGVATLSQADGIEMFNTLQEKVNNIKEPGIADDDVKRFTIDLVRKRLEATLEQQHLHKKAVQYRKLLADGKQEEATLYFQKYMERMLAGTSLPVADKFASASDDEIQLAINEKLGQAFVRERYALDIEDQKVIDVVAKYDVPTTEPAVLNDQDRAILDSQRTMLYEDLVKYEPNTAGSKLLKELADVSKQASILLKKLGEDPDAINGLDGAELQTIESLQKLMTIPARISIEDTTIEIPQNLLMMRKRLEEKVASSADIDHIKNLYDAYKQEMAIRENQIDALTGLRNRGEYTIALADKLMVADLLPAGESIRTMFIDLGFLQYFNTGGREVGNLALQRTGEMMEEALRRTGIAGEAFRYAGDEFTILFNGSKEDETRLLKALDEVRNEVGEIPRTERSGELYRPEKLMLNYGTADHQLAKDAMQRVYERKVNAGEVLDTESDEYFMYLANLQTRIADLGVDSQKSMSRFDFMFDRLQNDFHNEQLPSDMNLLQRQTELLVKYSQKALLGISLKDLNSDAHNPRYQLWDANGMPNPDAARNLAEYIEDKKKEEKVIAASEREIEDQLVRGIVEREYYQAKVVELQNKLASESERHRLDIAAYEASKQNLQRMLAEEAQDLTRIEHLRNEIANHESRGSTIEQKRNEITTLQNRVAEIVAEIDRLQSLPTIRDPQLEA